MTTEVSGWGRRGEPWAAGSRVGGWGGHTGNRSAHCHSRRAGAALLRTAPTAVRPRSPEVIPPRRPARRKRGEGMGGERGWGRSLLSLCAWGTESPFLKEGKPCSWDRQTDAGVTGCPAGMPSGNAQRECPEASENSKLEPWAVRSWRTAEAPGLSKKGGEVWKSGLGYS